MARILLLDGVHPRARETFTAAGHTVAISPPLQGSALVEALQGCEAVVVRSATQLDAAALREATQLSVIGRAGAGLDNIDLDAAAGQGITVFNAPDSNSQAVAELVFGLMLCLARDLPKKISGTHSGIWPKGGLGSELRGRTLGVVGGGRIGGRVLAIGEAFGMTTLVSDPHLKPAIAEGRGWNLVELDGLLSRADIVSLHLPLTPETHHLINAERLACCKPGAWLINAARGGLVDTDALIQALRDPEHPLAGAALDVFAEEPLSPGHPLMTLDNVILTPHIGASTKEAQIAAAVLVAEKINRHLSLAPA